MSPDSDLKALLARERQHRYSLRRLLKSGFGGAILIAIFVMAVRTTEIDLQQFWERLPTIGEWLGQLFPPDFSELPNFLAAIWETLAIAIVGTGAAGLVALPLAVCVAHNITPNQGLAHLLRGFLNLLRGIDTAIFALFFVSIVGLGPLPVSLEWPAIRRVPWQSSMPKF